MHLTLESWRDPSTRQRGEQLLSALMQFQELRLPFLRGRSWRVDDGCRILADSIDMRSDERFALSLAARFHDIGLISVPDAILMKKGKLTPDEKSNIDFHTTIGGRILHLMYPDFPEAIEAIWWHHERPDGTGPHGLQGDMIPLSTSLVSLVGAVEAMANDRPHRLALKEEEVYREIDRGEGKQFDARIVAIFRRYARQVYAAVAPNHAAPDVELVHPSESASTSKTTAGGKSAHAQPESVSAPMTVRSATGKTMTGASIAARKMSSTEALNSLNPLVKKKDLVDCVNRGLELKPLAPVVNAVMSATSNARCSVDEVARIVGQDQALALRVLKVANSSAYSRGKQVDSLAAAVTRIGVQQIRSLVMGLGVLDEYSSVVSPYIDSKLFWEHSLSCGLVASGLAAMRSCKNRDDYFLWGMVHDLGRLILLTQLPETYAKVWEVAEDLDAPLDVVEARLLNMDHCSVLAHALEHWQFPREFLAPVVNHHQPVYKLKRLAPRVLEEAMTISLADKLAHALMLGDSGNGMLHPLDDLLNELKLSPSMVEELIRDIPEQAANLRLSLMSRSHVDEWPVFLDRARSRLRSAFRPLCVAMEPRTASVKMICDRLSAPGGESDPNLGILYLRDVREQPSVIARFEAVEKESEIDALPVIVLWDKGRMESEHAWLKNRRHLSFQLPIRFSTFLDSVNSLMG